MVLPGSLWSEKCLSSQATVGGMSKHAEHDVNLEQCFELILHLGEKMDIGLSSIRKRCHVQ